MAYLGWEMGNITLAETTYKYIHHPVSGRYFIPRHPIPD
jgi:hypothetical protein